MCTGTVRLASRGITVRNKAIFKSFHQSFQTFYRDRKSRTQGRAHREKRIHVRTQTHTEV